MAPVELVGLAGRVVEELLCPKYPTQLQSRQMGLLGAYVFSWSVDIWQASTSDQINGSLEYLSVDVTGVPKKPHVIGL